MKPWIRPLPAPPTRGMAFALAVLACCVAWVPADGRAAAAGERRCGWFSNPSPGNAWLHDRDGEWTIAIQGGHQAQGDWPPVFPPGTWIRSGNAYYGHGCACLEVRTDAAAGTVLEILSSSARPLAACREDPALAGVEEEL